MGMRTTMAGWTVAETCRCGASIEVHADLRSLSAAAETLALWRERHRSCLPSHPALGKQPLQPHHLDPMPSGVRAEAATEAADAKIREDWRKELARQRQEHGPVTG